MKKVHLLVISILAVGLMSMRLQSCNFKNQTSENWPELDYSQTELWYVKDNLKSVDIFYILPTCIWDWTDSLGQVQYYADPYNTEQRAAMLPSYELANEIFGVEANFYAPYYRQISLESWMQGVTILNKRFPKAMKDVEEAFNYFLEHKNNERPFILAGFSQGGKAVVELLKQMPKETQERMLAAYIIGYKVLESELEEYPNIIPAKGATELGVCINYNSLASVEAITSILANSALCINPVNWATDSTAATIPASQLAGEFTHEIAGELTVTLDPQHQVLIVKGLDPEKRFVPSLEKIIPKGNYHLLELELYKESLKKNVIQRIVKYKNVK